MTSFAMAIVLICGTFVISPTSTWAAYKPVSLKISSYLPSAVQGKAYSYSFLNRVIGGTGKPYSWRMTGTLPVALKFNVKTATMAGVISNNAKVKTYTLRVCATGVKKPVAASINTSCKTTRIKVLKAKVIPRSTGPAVSSETYVGNIEYPNLNTPAISGGCEAKTVPFTIEIYENQTGQILGTTATSLTFRWSASNNLVTVTFETNWGEMGPKVWKWDAGSLSGELPLFCRKLDTNELVNQVFVPFVGQQK
ncbi:MAG: putative Ig domain-containing protein [Candidatus Nanopelagicaceae bacterium]|nr:putative Ig domain-containing protein [Candidatus Nanopelagicaceae bacterium]